MVVVLDSFLAKPFIHWLMNINYKYSRLVVVSPVPFLLAIPSASFTDSGPSHSVPISICFGNLSIISLPQILPLIFGGILSSLADLVLASPSDSQCLCCLI